MKKWLLVLTLLTGCGCSLEEHPTEVTLQNQLNWIGFGIALIVLFKK